jgi:hypothetical protein
MNAPNDQKKLTGRVPREVIAMRENSRLPASFLDGFKGSPARYRMRWTSWGSYASFLRRCLRRSCPMLPHRENDRPYWAGGVLRVVEQTES